MTSQALINPWFPLGIVFFPDRHHLHNLTLSHLIIVSPPLSFFLSFFLSLCVFLFLSLSVTHAWLGEVGIWKENADVSDFHDMQSPLYTTDDIHVLKFHVLAVDYMIVQFELMKMV